MLESSEIDLVLDLVHTQPYTVVMQANIHEAKTHFSQLIDRALAGEEVIIAKKGQALVKLVPLEPVKTERIPGLSQGKGWISPDFDAELGDSILKEFET